MDKTIHRIYYVKKKRSSKTDAKDGKAFYEIMNTVFGKTMENMIDWVDVKLF